MISRDLLPIAKAMETICPNVLSLLKTGWNDTLSSYIKNVWQKPISCSSELAVQSRRRFYSAMKVFFASQPINFELAFSEFERFPLLQTGPHCQLYVNEIDFNALLVSWMGSQLHQMKHSFILNSVTRTLQWSKRHGPAWLDLKHDIINLFDLSPKQMSKLSVCSSFTRLSYCTENLTKYLTQADSYEKKGVEKLVKSISHEEYEGFIPAFTLTNQNLLKKYDKFETVNSVIMNDNFTAILVAEHLLDPEGIIYQLIFSSHKYEMLKQLVKSVMQEKQHIFLKQGTEYFWGVRDNKIRSLTIEDGFLKENTTNSSKQLKIPLDPQAIRLALIEGLLIPNIFLSFLVLSLMPQIRVLGGTRQIAYLPLIQNIFSELLKLGGPLEQELLHELLSNELSAWGTNFIRDETPPLEWLGRLPDGEEFTSLSEYYLEKSVAEITKELAVFKEHPTWKYMI